MKKILFFIVLGFTVGNSAWGQTLEWQPVPSADESPTIEEIRNDAGFMSLLRQMPNALHLSQEPFIPSTVELMVDHSQKSVVPSQFPSSLLTAIVVQQLAQLDNCKRELLLNLHNAETFGYRAARLEPNEDCGYEVKTDFQSRRYVSSHSKLDWAIHGDGFFVLRKPGEPFNTGEPELPENIDALYSSYSINTDRIYYTRAGRFELTEDNKLCLKHRGEVYLLQPEQDISLWFGNKELVEDNGAWSIIANFDRPERLRRIDGVLFQAEPDGEKPKPNEPFSANLRSQEYEASNVDVAETLHLYRALHRLQSAMLEQLSY